MRQTVLWGLAWLVFTVSTAPSTLAAAEIPPVLEGAGSEARGDLPAWVSLEAAFGPDGTLRREYFTEAESEGLEESLPSILHDPGLGCTLVEEWDLHRPDMSELSTPRMAARRAEAIALVTVEDSAVGLFRGVPGTLLLAEVSARFRGFSTLERVYFFVPVAKYQVGDRKYCKIDRRYPELPHLGDQALLMVPSIEDPSNPLVDLIYETNLVVFPRGKKEVLLSSTALRHEASLIEADRDSILADVLAEVARDE